MSCPPRPSAPCWPGWPASRRSCRRARPRPTSRWRWRVLVGRDGGRAPGEPSGFSCPDCSGVLWAIRDGGLQRFRCRVGHAWSPESLLTRQSEALEAALWIALRSLEERAALARRLGEPARRRGHTIIATRFEEQATETQQAARVVRELLVGGTDG
jgi:hypothetical protein